MYGRRPFHKRRAPAYRRRTGKQGVFDPVSLGASAIARNDGDVLASAMAERNSSGQSTLTYRGSNGAAPFPDRYFHRMRWTSGAAVDPGSGTLPNAATAYVANSLLPPDRWSGFTAIPLPYFEIMGNIYGNFIVHGSKITVRCESQTDGGQVAMALVIFPTMVAPTGPIWFGYVPDSLAGFRAWPNAHKIFKVGNQSQPDANRTCSMFMNCSQFSSLDGDQNSMVGRYASQPYLDTAADPAQLMYWGVAAYAWDGSTFADQVQCQIQIDYWVESFVVIGSNTAVANQVTPKKPGEGGGEEDPLLEEDFEDMELEVRLVASARHFVAHTC